MIKTPKITKSKKYKTAEEALAAIKDIYDGQINFLREQFDEFGKGKLKHGDKVSAFYPYVRISTKYARRTDSRLAYGFAPKPGAYSTTMTRPDIFEAYYLEQLKLIVENHDVPLEVGVSDVPVPLHFALGEAFHLENELSEEQLQWLPQIFDVPNLDIMDDEIASGTYIPKPDKDEPLALFTAQRVDLSLQRLKHYCGTSPEHFQNYVIFTNYQFYIDEFIKICNDMMAPSDDLALKKQRQRYECFVQPGDQIQWSENLSVNNKSHSDGKPLKRLPQMPAYHLKAPNGDGITMINIGVGPSNAKTITDHVAVLRPHAWLMLGHCAGLRNSQRLGDYVLAHGYLREDHILDVEVPLSIPIPALAEVQVALEQAVAQITGSQ